MNKLIIPYLLALAVSIPLMGIDLHLPSLPLMEAYFHTTSALMKNSMSTYQFGMLGSTIVYGPLSDTYGRKPILLLGFTIFVFSSILLIFAQGIDSFLIFRFIQGCGGGVSAALVPAILSDKFEEAETSKALAQMAVLILITPAVAPIAGGYLTAYFGWQSCFIVLSLISFISTFIFFFFLPETHEKENRTEARFNEMFINYKSIFKNKKFMLYALIHSLPSIVSWCLITMVPFILINHMGVKTQHLGFYITSQVFAVAGTSYYVQRVVIRQGVDKLLQNGLIFMFVAGFTGVLASIFTPLNPIITLVSLLPFFIGYQYVFPTSISKAMTSAAGMRGIGSSTLTTLRQAFSFLGSLVAVMMPDSTILVFSLFMIFIVCCLLALHRAAQRA